MSKTRDNKQLLALVLALLAGSFLSVRMAQAGPQTPSDEEDRRVGVQGISKMMDGDLEGAAVVFQQIERRDPDSPLGFVLEADATWWKIYYISSDLVDPDVFAVAGFQSTPYDSHFQDLDNVAIHKAETRIKEQQDVARSYLYQGYAYALRARLEGLRDRDLPTARAGKRMRSLLLHAVALDPHLTDAYLGLGIYNYFVDTLPTIVKVLSVFIMLPGGSRTEGLEQLELCAEKGELGAPEAKFYLAKDYTRSNEMRYQESARLFGQLQQKFPHNPLWPMLVGSLQFRLKNPAKGEELYRGVLQSTAGKNSEVSKAVHHAVSQALERLHPGQQFP